MKLLTIAAAATALTLSSVGAFADGKGGHAEQLKSDFYATAAGQAYEPAIEAPSDGVALTSMSRGVDRPAPTVSDEAPVRRSIYRTTERNRVHAARYDRQEGHAVRDTDAAVGDEPLGPKVQPQEQAQRSMYDVNAGKHGNIAEYQ